SRSSTTLMKYGSSVRCSAVRKSFSLFSKCQKMRALETCASLATCESEVLAKPWVENRRVAVPSIFSRVSTRHDGDRIPPLLSTLAPPAEHRPEDHARHEPADVRPHGHPAGRAGPERRDAGGHLQDEPQQEEEDRGDLHDLDEQE